MPDYETLPASVQRYAAVLRRQWWVVLLVPILAVGAAVAYIKTTKPVYQASSKVVVGQGETLFAPGLSVDVQAFTQTISDLLESNVVAQDTIDALHLNTTPTTLLGNLTVSSQPTGAVINVGYNDTDRTRAVRILSTLGRVFTVLVDSKLAGHATATAGAGAANQAATQPVSAVVFDPAHSVPGTVSPKVTRSIAVAIVLGLIGGVLLAVLRDALSSTIKNESEAESAYGGESIGTLPRGMIGVSTSELALMPQKRRIRMTEAINMLVARLRYSTSLERGLIVITGARPEDGKTTLAAHLAAELAAAGKDVIAIEADLHRPALHRLLGQPPGQPGIREVSDSPDEAVNALLVVDSVLRSPVDTPNAEVGLATSPTPARPRGRGERSSRDSTQNDHSSGGRLRMLPAGNAPGNPMNLLSVNSVSALIARLREDADIIVVDTPPLLLAGESYPLLQRADQVVVVCRRGSTRQHEATRARDILHSLGIRNYSVVLSEADSGDGHYYGYGS